MNAFDHIPRTARGHLGLLFHEAAYRVLYHVRGRAQAGGRTLDDVFREFPFLSWYFGEIRPYLPAEINWPDSVEWLQRQTEEWELEAGAALPLSALRQQAAAQHETLLAFILIGLVEEDARFASLFAVLQQPAGYRRPTMGLLRDILFTNAATASIEIWDVCRPLMQAHAVEEVNRESPRSEWVLRVPPPVWCAARGDNDPRPLPSVSYRAPEGFSEIGDLILPQPQLVQLRELAGLLATGRTRAVIVRGMAGSDRLEVAGAVGRALGRGLLEFEVDPSAPPSAVNPFYLAGILAVMRQAMPLFHAELAPGETLTIPSLACYEGPVCVIAGLEGGLAGSALEHAVTVQLEPESPELRLNCWRQAFNGQAVEDLSSIAERFCLAGGHIRRSARIAKTYAALDKRDAVRIGDVSRACRSLNRQHLDTLATHLEGAGDWSGLVTTASTGHDLLALERRCRHRERLPGSVGPGFPGGLNRGVRALFEGPSGTGKTLAARVLASQLNLDLYRVDLAALVNKYIGETEKNLSRLLSRAEELDVMLLMDEGDALMARRTSVQSSNDRYANLQTNYLLQRLETYTGVIVVTTNNGSNVDIAFRRRMDATVKFHLPEAQERWSLWCLHLPAGHQLPPVTLEQIALRYVLTGGQIRNAAIYAALLAMERDSGTASATINTADVRTAVEREYRKAGSAFPEHGGSHTAAPRDIPGFLESIA